MKYLSVVGVIAFSLLTAQFALAGDFSSYKRVGNKVSFQLSETPEAVEVIVCKDDIVRVRISDKKGEFQPDSLYPDHYGPYLVVKYDWKPVAFTVVV